MRRRDMLWGGAAAFVPSWAGAQCVVVDSDVGALACRGGIAGGAPPSLDLNFLTGSLPGAVIFTRATGNATYWDIAGSLQTAGVNVARFDYDPVSHAPLGLLIEEARTNSVRNNIMTGAVAGSPGTLPTNWAITAPSGLTRTIALGTMAGISYVDLNYAGTASSTTNISLAFDPLTGTATPAATGQIWTNSCSLAVPVSHASLTTTVLQVRGTNGATQTEVFGGTNMLSTLQAGSWMRATFTATLAVATTTNVMSRLATNSIASGTAVNFTIRIGLPQLELATATVGATSAILTPIIAVLRAADVWSVPDTGWLVSGAGRATIEGTTLDGVPFSTTQVGDAGHLNPVASVIAATPNARVTRLRYWKV